MNATTKERPILFKGEMVRAILNGRKTMTRRVVKPQPKGETSHARYWCEETGEWEWMYNAVTAHPGRGFFCPYGKTGDRLWVRETFRLSTREDCTCYEPCYCRTGVPIYRVDMDHGEENWKPSIFMPRWASRILLEVTDVRIERLQDITEKDALAEGTSCPVTIDGAPLINISHRPSAAEFLNEHNLARFSKGENLGTPFDEDNWIIAHFAALWESINGDGSWDANPYVWMVEFKRVQP